MDGENGMNGGGSASVTLSTATICGEDEDLLGMACTTTTR